MNYNDLLNEAKAKVKDNLNEEALSLFQKALEVNSKGKEVLYERAVLYTNLKKNDLALFDLNKLIELENDNPFFYACRAFVKTGLKDMSGAILDYQETIKLDPEDAIAHNNLGLLQEQYSYKSDAEKSFERSNEILGYNPNRYDSARELKSAEEPASKETLSKSTIIKSIFTSKSGFKEFLEFIKNGFKLKNDDKS
ncbi:MAG: tetratricopeptide repeat protein [Crocinitomicaceae bacterium]